MQRHTYFILLVSTKIFDCGSNCCQCKNPNNRDPSRPGIIGTDNGEELKILNESTWSYFQTCNKNEIRIQRHARNNHPKSQKYISCSNTLTKINDHHLYFVLLTVFEQYPALSWFTRIFPTNHFAAILFPTVMICPRHDNTKQRKQCYYGCTKIRA